MRHLITRTTRVVLLAGKGDAKKPMEGRPISHRKVDRIIGGPGRLRMEYERGRTLEVGCNRGLSVVVKEASAGDPPDAR